MIEQQHIIHRQTLEIKIPEKAGAQALQQELSHLLRNQILPKLQTIFSALTPNHQFLQLQKLEINLGIIDPIQAPQKFVTEAIRHIEEAVKQASNDAVKEVKPTNTKQAVFLSPEVAMREQFLYFLETGLLPWWGTSLNEDNLLATLRENNATFQNQLNKVLGRNSKAIQRLFLQNKKEVIQATILQLSGNERKEVSEWFLWLSAILEKQSTEFKKQIWVSSIEFLANQKKVVLIDLLLKNLTIILASVSLNQHQELVKSFSKTFINESQLFKPLNHNSFSKKNKVLSTKKVCQKILAQQLHDLLISPTPSGIQETTSFFQEIPLIPKKAISKNTYSQNNPNQAEEAIFITNAGLIMLAPLLPSYFEQAGLLKDKIFINEAAKERGIHLLQYLVTDTEAHPEYELALNKILCGVALETPIERQIYLSKKEKELSQELLIYAIKEWKALKNSSPATLQALFLQREGKLTFDEPNWTLRVEEQALDVLLGKLPWGFSIVKLPWMEGMVFGEWG